MTHPDLAALLVAAIRRYGDEAGVGRDDIVWLVDLLDAAGRGLQPVVDRFDRCSDCPRRRP
jgi:hypothetical protein